uniref:Exocyst complex component 7 n=1 Tax=Macrostomum lignano TaxID=282301 RepID=A0A1I8FIK1_9PLAT
TNRILDADDVNAMLTAFLRYAMSFEASVRANSSKTPNRCSVFLLPYWTVCVISDQTCPLLAKDLAKDMQTQARSSLEDFRDEIVKDGGGAGGGSEARRGGGSAGPGGGIVGGGSGGASDLGVLAEVAGGGPCRQTARVHELTLKVLKFLQQLHDFGDTAHEILAREVILGRQQQQQHGGRQQPAAAQQKEKDKVLGAYLSQTLANLLRTLDSRAEHYSDPALRAIFLLNNYRYVQNDWRDCRNAQQPLSLAGRLRVLQRRQRASAAQPTVGNSSSGHSDGHSRRLRRRRQFKSMPSVVVKVCRCQSISCFFYLFSISSVTI